MGSPRVRHDWDWTELNSSSHFVNYLFTIPRLSCPGAGFFLGWDLGQGMHCKAIKQKLWDHWPSLLSQSSWLRLRVTDQRTASSTGLEGGPANSATDAEPAGLEGVKRAGAAGSEGHPLGTPSFSSWQANADEKRKQTKQKQVSVTLLFCSSRFLHRKQSRENEREGPTMLMELNGHQLTFTWQSGSSKP